MRCRICENNKKNRSFEAKEMTFGYRDVFRYFQCANCNCLQIEEFPSDMSKYYPDSYYSYQPVADKNSIKRLITNLGNKYAIFNKGLIGKLVYFKYPYPKLRSLSKLGLNKDLYILDIGCGAGSLLYSLSVLGFKNLLGVDPFNDKDIEYNSGLKIQRKTIHDIQDKWHLIMFHHSFEHIPDPLDTFKKVSDSLKPNGICLIRIPTVSSYAWKHYGINWVQLDAPRHFFLHSVESIEILAKKTDLELYDVSYDSTAAQFWGSEQCKKDISLRDKRSYLETKTGSIFSNSEITAYEKRAEELNAANQGDQAAFYLKKT